MLACVVYSGVCQCLFMTLSKTIRLCPAFRPLINGTFCKAGAWGATAGLPHRRCAQPLLPHAPGAAHHLPAAPAGTDTWHQAGLLPVVIHPAGGICHLCTTASEACLLVVSWASSSPSHPHMHTPLAAGLGAPSAGRAAGGLRPRGARAGHRPAAGCSICSLPLACAGRLCGA
jgi:hypothetical protein